MPTATKGEVRDEFNELFMRVLKKPEFVKKFAEYGFAPEPMPTKVLSPFIEKEYASWKKAIDISGITLD